MKPGKKAMNPIRSLKRRLYPLASRYVIWSMLVEGDLKNTGTPFRCLFVDNSLFTKYLLHKAFAEPVRIVGERRIWIPSLRKTIRSPFMADVDLCIALLPRRYEPAFRGLYAFKATEHVRQVIETADPWDEIRKRFHRNRRRIADDAAGKYSYRVSTDPRDFDFFYHRMYLPHTMKKFGDIAALTGYEEMKRLFMRGCLLLVSDPAERQPVAGALCYIENRTLAAYSSGVLDGDEARIKNGAQSILYYFLLSYAKKLNLNGVDVMKSRLLLNGAVYKTKRSWGAAVRPDEAAGSWVFFFIPRYSGRVAGFFEQNPVVVHTDEGLKGVVGASGDYDLTDDFRGELHRQFYAPGLEGLIILYPDRMPAELSFGGSQETPRQAQNTADPDDGRPCSEFVKSR